MNPFVLITIVVLGLSSNLVRADGIESDACPKPVTAKDVLECIRKRSPENLHAKGDLERSQALVDQAAQIPNPEAQIESIYGKNDIGDQSDELTASIEQPIEIGGRRSSRIAAAESQVTKSQHELALAESKTVIEGMLKLHRLRQIQAEKGTIAEAIATFEKLVQQFSQRPRLTPEQEVSQSVFRMSKSDYEFRQAGNTEEELEVLKSLKLASGLSDAGLLGALPKDPNRWPELKVGQPPKSLALAIKQAELQSFEADLDQARAQSWPDLKFGPVFKSQKDGLVHAKSFGFSLSFSLPFWNQNGGGRAAAHKNLLLGELAVKTQSQTDEAESVRLRSVYENAVKVLKQSPSPKDLARKHESLEKQFFRGLVSSSLVIEAHRSLADLQKNRNERELKTLETLWSIYLYQNRVLAELAQAKELQ